MSGEPTLTGPESRVAWLMMRYDPPRRPWMTLRELVEENDRRGGKWNHDLMKVLVFSMLRKGLADQDTTVEEHINCYRITVAGQAAYRKRKTDLKASGLSGEERHALEGSA